MSRTHLMGSVERYLALRRALGFKLRNETWFLPDFVTFLEAHGTSVITTELALRWAQQPPGGTPYYWAKRLSAVRCFAKHHRAFDPRHRGAPSGPHPVPCATPTAPHLYGRRSRPADARGARLARRDAIGELRDAHRAPRRDGHALGRSHRAQRRGPRLASFVTDGTACQVPEVPARPAPRVDARGASRLHRSAGPPVPTP